MVESFVEVLLDTVPHQEIRGIYLKGSALKHWDTPIDYVPEISDVDMHIYFHDDDSWRRHIGTVEQAIEIQRRVEELYLAKAGRPLHTPRPQLIVLNRLMRQVDFVGSPPGTVEVLYGEAEAAVDYSDPERIRRLECNRLIEDADFLAVLPLQVVDKPGRYLWQSLRALTWRVSPAGPRVLHICGVDTEEAWSLNRTGVVSQLRDLGQHGLADHYSEFYLSSWDYFLSHYENNNAGRSAIAAGAQALSLAVGVARRELERRGVQ